jgi:phage baseplate assembly protein gpV
MLQGTKSNDIVTVNVTLTSVNGVFGAALEVPFNTPNTSYVGYTAGTALEQGGNTPIYTVDGATQPGRVIVGVARSGSAGTNVSGTMTLISLKFRVNTAGTWPLTFENSNVYDGQQPTPQPIPGLSWFAGALKGV